MRINKLLLYAQTNSVVNVERMNMHALQTLLDKLRDIEELRNNLTDKTHNKAHE